MDGDNIRVCDMAERIIGLSEDERLTMSKDFLSNGKNAFNSVAGHFSTIGDLYNDIGGYVKVLRQQRKQPKTIMNYLDYLKHALERISFVRSVFDDDNQRRLILSCIGNQVAATRRSMKSMEHVREENADTDHKADDENSVCRDDEQVQKQEYEQDDDAWSLSSGTNKVKNTKDTDVPVIELTKTCTKTISSDSATQDTKLMRIFEMLPDIFVSDDNIVVPTSLYRRVMTSVVDIVKIALS
jgi:hypothetical protein